MLVLVTSARHEEVKIAELLKMLIVSCPVCPPASLATDTDSSFIKVKLASLARVPANERIEHASQ